MFIALVFPRAACVVAVIDQVEGCCMNCQIQIHFLAHQPTYKSALCQGGVGVTTTAFYRTPGIIASSWSTRSPVRRARRWFTIE